MDASMQAIARPVWEIGFFLMAGNPIIYPAVAVMVIISTYVLTRGLVQDACLTTVYVRIEDAR